TSGNVVVITPNGTSNAVAITITPAPTTPTISGVTAICAGNSTTITASAGSAYLWSTGATTQTISVSTAGSYTVQTIASGCTSLVSTAAVVSVTSLPTTPTISGTPTISIGGGSTILTSSIGSGYVWSNGATTQSITVTSPGIYSVRTISGNCTSLVSNTIPVNWDIQGYNVSTLAGSGTATFADGTGTAASFYRPWGLAIDASENIYVADAFNNRIRKISPTGVVTTLAGSGTPAYSDGTGVSASFTGPSGVAVDLSGNVYVADQYNHRIRKITSAGVVTTLAGNGTAAFGNGTGTAAYFNYPTGIAVDANGFVYVADQNNHRIRKISPAGVVTTFAGSGSYGYSDGASGVAMFRSPTDVKVDANGYVYVADYGNNTIRKITPEGVVSTIAGSGTVTGGYADGNGTSAAFNRPASITLDAVGNIFVADQVGERIRKITTNGDVTTISGSGTGGFANGSAANSVFNRPIGITSDISGNIYVGDYNNNRVRKISPCGTPATTPTISGALSFCSGSSTTLTAPASIGYLWSNGATTQSITVSTAGSYTVSIFNGSCTSNVSATSTVSVNALPITPTISGATAVCSGNSTTITTSRVLGTNEAYLWSDNSSASTLSVSTAGTYSLRIRNTVTGCTSAVSNSIAVSITPLPTTP
ncbi:MAG: NHL repeat-containing protein, partial [Dolichospermum sp.]